MSVKHSSKLGAVVVVMLALPLVSTTSAHPPTVAHAASPGHVRRLVIQGAGDGHGVGMSQEGALGYARHGYSYEAILAHYYTGSAIGDVPHKRIVRVLVGGQVRRIPLERYVRGVVSAEMPASWPSAALEAQAVASRTFALTAHAGGSKFDVYADTRSQVYEGRAAETPQTNAAVAATAGQVVTYAGHPAITYFFACSGGITEAVQNGFPGSAPEPWLQGVVDPYDQGPQHRWTITITMASAAARLGGLVRGSLRGIEVLKRGYSPRILSAYVLGSGGRTLVSGPDLAARLGLHGTWAYFGIAGAHGTHPEPDLSHYAPPPGNEARSAPQAGAGGGSAAGAPARVPASEHGGAAAAVSSAAGGGTPSG
jgi:stage II sporulation protein D